MKKVVTDFCISKRAQIWVETVIYILIALVLIAAVLAFVRPKIQEMGDKAIIENTIGMLKSLDNVIIDIRGAAGNQRTVELGVKDGFLEIYSEEDLLYFEFDGVYEYSEPGEPISNGNLDIETERRGDDYRIKITRNYTGSYNLTYDNLNFNKMLSSSPTPYSLVILNKGHNESLGGTLLNFEVA